MAVFFVQVRRPDTSNPWETLLKLNDQGQARAVAKALCRYPDSHDLGVTARAISTTQLQRQSGINAVRQAEAAADSPPKGWGKELLQAEDLAEQLGRITSPAGPTGDFLIRDIPLDLRERMKLRAVALGLTANQWVIKAIANRVNKEEEHG